MRRTNPLHGIFSTPPLTEVQIAMIGTKLEDGKVKLTASRGRQLKGKLKEVDQGNFQRWKCNERCRDFEHKFPKRYFCIYAYVYMMLDPIRESRNAKRGLYIQQWAGGEVT